MVWQAEVVL